MDELVLFIATPSTPRVVREKALQSILELSASAEGPEFILRSDGCVDAVLSLVENPDVEIHKKALQTIVNISINEHVCQNVLSRQSSQALLSALVKNAAEDGHFMEVSCMALSNLTRESTGCKMVWNVLVAEDGRQLESFVSLLLLEKPSVNHVAPFLCNLSQLDSVRRRLLDRNSNLLIKLLSLISYPYSSVRRKGVVGIIRNCCFDTGSHEWLLGDEIDIIPKLALPLAGPEEFDDDENDKLPIELQYLGEEKKREAEPEIRKMLIESINQLCATKFGRSFIKEKNIYYIMRELHKWETRDDVIIACENLVDILIGDEPGVAFENLKSVEIPEDLQVKFKKMDEDDMNS